jgi:hypothetical protein
MWGSDLKRLGARPGEAPAGVDKPSCGKYLAWAVTD